MSWYAAKYPFLQGLGPQEAVMTLVRLANMTHEYYEIAKSRGMIGEDGLRRMRNKYDAYLRDARAIQRQFNVNFGFGSSFERR